MRERSQIHNFGAGPSPLPTLVLEQASKDLLNYQSNGMGLAELSHRSATAASILSSAGANLKLLLDAPEGYEVLWMQGGGTAQFSAVVYNLVAHYIGTSRGKRIKNQKDIKLDYILTGGWSKKAYEEAIRLGIGTVNIVTDARKYNNGKWGVVPDESQWNWSNPEDTAYAYYCDNETVDGVEFPGPITTIHSDVPLAGAQKNISIPGVTILLVRRTILERSNPSELLSLGIAPGPIILDYQTTAQNNSLYNTLPIFSVHIANLVFENTLARGGLAAQESLNKEKSQLLYSSLIRAAKEGKIALIVAENCRSRMNVPFKFTGGPVVDAAFLKGAEERGMLQLKGHRSIGGIRASLYNAVEYKNVEAMVMWLEEFLKTL